MSVIRSVSGLRATLGTELTPMLVSKYAAAFAKILPEGHIIVGRDGRQSGEWIENIVAGTLQACGREVIILGIVPTPTLQFIIEDTQASGGISITASHNPSEWNGLKFINNKGVFLNADENNWLWDKTDREEFHYYESNKFAKVIHRDDAIKKHIYSILDLPFLASNIHVKSQSMGLSAVVDAVNASGSKAVPELLSKIGVRAIPLYCDSSGVFPHTPEPIPDNLQALCDAVKLHKASMGIAVDPDSDRLVLIDENGKPIGEERTIALAIMSILEDFDKLNGYNKIVVVNHSTSLLSERAAELYGAEVHRSAVGEINVINKMKELNAVIGGEGSGGVVLPASHYGRDAMVGIALILNLMTKLNMKLSQISAKLGDTFMIKTKYELKNSPEDLFEFIAKKYSTYQIIREDGIKIIFDDAWVQLRASNTEPIIRIIAESDDKERTTKLINEFSELL